MRVWGERAGKAAVIAADALGNVPILWRERFPLIDQPQLMIDRAHGSWIVVGLVSPASFAFTTALLWTWAGMVYGRRDVVLQEWRPSRRLPPLAEARPTLS